MKKDLVKLAVMGLTAGLCVSGQSPHQQNQEIAMTKCTKDTGDMTDTNSDQGSCNAKQGSSSCSNTPPSNVQSGQSDQDTTSSNMSNQRKSAARRAIESENQ